MNPGKTHWEGCWQDSMHPECAAERYRAAGEKAELLLRSSKSRDGIAALVILREAFGIHPRRGVEQARKDTKRPR